MRPVVSGAPNGTGRRLVASRAVAVVGAMALVLGACGVQLDEAPRPLAVDSIPYDLLEPSTTVPPGTGETSPSAPARVARVFLVDNDGYLVEVRRELDDVGVGRVVSSLLSPLSEAERDAGLGTAISSATRLRGVIGPEDGLVTVDLSSEADDVSPDKVRVALAQLVFTATAVPGVDRVLFQIDGQAREVPTGKGQSTAEPLSRLDYRQLLRPPTSTTTLDDELDASG